MTQLQFIEVIILKKLVVVLFAVCFMLVSVVPALAKTPVEDAFDIDAKTRALLEADEEDTVIRFYSGYFMHGFAKGMPLEEILNDGWAHKLTEYIIISEENGKEVITYKRVRATDGELETVSDEIYEKMEKWHTEVYKIIKDPEKKLNVLGPFITVNKVVFLDGYYTDGLYIYYETSIGDYVYYRLCPEEDEEYLVPLDEFVEYAKEEQAIRSVTDGGNGGNETAIKKLYPYELSHYTLTPRRIWFAVLFYAVPVGVVVGIWIFIASRNKRKRNVCCGCKDDQEDA